MAKRKGKATEVPKAPEGLRVIALEVQNVKRVRLVRIVPKGNLITVSGKNGSGKSSLLDGIIWALTGTSDMAAMPIRAGEDAAHITLDLGEFIVHRTITRVHDGKTDFITKLRIEGKNREVYPTPQKLLDSFMGAFTFDPVAFMRLEGSDQVKAMRKVVTFAEDIDALEKEAKQVYEDRRVKGREYEAARARFMGLPESIDGLPENPIDTQALTERLGQAANHNSVVDRSEQRKASLLELAQAEAERATMLREEAHKLLQQAEELDGLHIPVPAGTMGKGKIQELRAQAEAIQIDPREDVASLTAELQTAQRINAGIRQREARANAQKEMDQAGGEFTALQERYDGLMARRKKAITEAKMPIEGLSVDFEAGQVLWHGMPLAQASTAEQIRVSATMAMALSPKLRIMHIKDGSLLDDESMAILEEMAETHNYQVWVERVAGDQAVGIVMEDGEAHGEGVQA